MFNQKEKELRRAFNKLGCSLHKSRARDIHANDFGGYMIVDNHINGCVAGNDYSLDISEVESFLDYLQTE